MAASGVNRDEIQPTTKKVKDSSEKVGREREAVEVYSTLMAEAAEEDRDDAAERSVSWVVSGKKFEAREPFFTQLQKDPKLLNQIEALFKQTKRVAKGSSSSAPHRDRRETRRRGVEEGVKGSARIRKRRLLTTRQRREAKRR